MILFVFELRYLNSDNQKFVEYCKEKMGLCGGLDLACLLVHPCSRIPRYELLIREILKNTDDSHPDTRELESCYEELKKINSKINDSNHSVK